MFLPVKDDVLGTIVLLTDFFTIPINTCGLGLDEEAVRVAVGLSLEASISKLHNCPCESIVAADVSQGLSCGFDPVMPS